MRIPAFLERRGWFFAIAFAYLYVFPLFPKVHSANELPRAYLVKAIADEHRFAIDTGVRRWGGTADVSPAGGHQYSNKAPGSSMLAVPAYLVVRAVAGEPSLPVTLWLARVVAGILPMLLFLRLLWRFLERFAPDPDVRRIVLVTYALGSLAMPYAILFYSHQLGAVCVASAWILALEVAEGRRGLRAMVAAGLLAGAAPLIDYQAVFAAVPVAIHVVAKLRAPADGRGARSWRVVGTQIAVAAAAAAVPIAILLGYHAACFGSPWRTGYDASTTFAIYHQQGFLGVTRLRWEAFYGSLLRPDNGLFVLAPWLVLAIPGAIALARGARGVVRDRAIAAVGVAVAIIYVAFISSINFWRGGWQVGPRYIAAMLPFLLPLVAATMQALATWRRRDPRAAYVLGAAAGLCVVGVAIYALTCATFPYWPDSLRHPLYEVTFRLLGDGLVAPNLGTALGLGGLASLVPYAAVIATALARPILRLGGKRGLALALGVAAAVLGGYAGFAHGGAQADRAYAVVRSAVLAR